MSHGAETWGLLLSALAVGFTEPSSALFRNLVHGWVLCPCRRTVTQMIRLGDPEGAHAHDAYHRLLRTGAWTMPRLWKTLTLALVTAAVPAGDVLLDVDDTLFHKVGRKVSGSGIFRDAVRSTVRRVVYARGLNLVVLTLRVSPPWGGEPLGLPVNLRLYHKGGATHLDLAEEMVREIASWLPERSIRLAGDGAYASLARRGMPRTHVTSRMRRDAALFELPPPRKPHQRGRPRKRGARLPTPEAWARSARLKFQSATIEIRGRTETRLLASKQVLWYAVCPSRPVLLVVVRDPAGKQPDDFFFTTDLEATAAAVASHYSGRWSIEDTFRNVKQVLGGEQPQCWAGQGPERTAALSFWIYSAVWLWYLRVHGSRITWTPLPWYPLKRSASFADALAALRRALWRQRVFPTTEGRALPMKLVDGLIDALARAA
jgi:hypothetical protein